VLEPTTPINSPPPSPVLEPTTPINSPPASPVVESPAPNTQTLPTTDPPVPANKTGEEGEDTQYQMPSDYDSSQPTHPSATNVAPPVSQPQSFPDPGVTQP
jgi:hypothetical protein